MRDPFKFDASPRRQRAFNLLELIAVLAAVGLLAAMTLPALGKILQRERTEGFLRSATLAVERSKGEAAKRSVPVVVRADYAQGAFYGFADLDRDGFFDPPEPELFYLVLPAGGAQPEKALRFWAPTDAAPQGAGAVTGFSADPTPGTFPGQLILDPDGSARAAGAFRFGLSGPPGNFYEVRIEPAATGRVQLRKYLWQDSPAFLARNPESAAAWPWY